MIRSIMNNTDKTTKKSTEHKRRKNLVILLAAVLITGILAGGLLAKYRSDNQRQAEMVAAQFHVSSDYLTDDTNSTSYNITDWQSGFTIRLYNYEKENTALISDENITYTVSLSDTSKWTCSDEKGGKIAKSAERTSQDIVIRPQGTAGAGDKITVTVNITAPFTKTLSATFTMKDKHQPDYSVKDKNDGTILVTIQSNGYSGKVELNWSQDKFAPDNTNPLMNSWTGNAQSLDVEKNTTYELLFFRKSVESVSETSGSGTKISLS